jgi:hypothetical protein
MIVEVCGGILSLLASPLITYELPPINIPRSQCESQKEESESLTDTPLSRRILPLDR